jgi:tetratricopeptide (TPR) repeat protein
MWGKLTNLAEVCAWIEAVGQSGKVSTPALQLKALLLLSSYLESLARFDAARDYAQQALQLAGELEDEDGLVLSNRLHCLINFRQGHFEQAQRYADDALRIAEGRAKPALLVKALRSRESCLLGTYAFSM